MRFKLPCLFISFVLVVVIWLVLFKDRTKQPITFTTTSANLSHHLIRYGPIINDNIGNKAVNTTKVKVLSRGELGKWNDETNMCHFRSDFVRAHLKYPGNTPIFVYEKAIDTFVSGSILNYGMWEGDLVTKIHDFLREDTERTFLDLGSNVGVFSLMAAKNGHKVFAVDMLEGNVQRLCASCLAGNFHEQVTIIHNALSDVRGRASFGTHKGNIGGTFVKKLDDTNLTNDVETVPAILLDDLLEIFKFKKVIIKMDLEKYEEKTLKGGEQFFKEAQVDYVLLEFGYHRTRPSGRSIIEILDGHGMVPMLESVQDVRKLTDSEIKQWPSYVTWRRKIKVEIGES